MKTRFAVVSFCAAISLSSPLLADEGEAQAETQTAEPSDPSDSTAAGAGAPSSVAETEVHRVEERRRAAEEEGNPLAADRLRNAVERWKRVARVWLEVAQAAKAAAELEAQTTELVIQTRRARTLVEQTEARRARALGELRKLGVDAIAQSADPGPVTPASAARATDAAPAPAADGPPAPATPAPATPAPPRSPSDPNR